MAMSSSVSHPLYKKPPILEAVIALHFSTTLDFKEITTFANRRRAEFPFSEDMVEMSAAFNPLANQSISTMKKLGRKLTSADGSDVVILLPTQFAVIQRAPYTDWDTLCVAARANWDVLYKIIRRKRLTHVSTRYINRIDIPLDINARVDLHKYFNIGLSLPSFAQSMELQAFHVISALLHPSGKYRYAVNFAATPPQLIDHMSFTLDIDLSTIDPPPEHQDKMWEFVGSLRRYKNDLFEACVTDETRELFQ
jgi:uncharacterized protein (TIGR04255 family)